MAKIKMGAVVVDISGKLGGHVFARNTGGNYMRTKVTPTNPQTSFQSLIRSTFAAISSAWSGLTEAQRDSFRSKVELFKRTNVFGDLKKPTAKSLYQRLNQNLSLTQQAQVSTCPDPADVPSALIMDASASVGGATFDVVTNGDTTGSKVMVWATPSLSQGKKFVKNDLRYIGVYDGGVDVTCDIHGDYIFRFGAFNAGNNIHVGVQVVDRNGQASPRNTYKATISA